MEDYPQYALLLEKYKLDKGLRIIPQKNQGIKEFTDEELSKHGITIKELVETDYYEKFLRNHPSAQKLVEELHQAGLNVMTQEKEYTESDVKIITPKIREEAVIMPTFASIFTKAEVEKYFRSMVITTDSIILSPLANKFAVIKNPKFMLTQWSDYKSWRLSFANWNYIMIQELFKVMIDFKKGQSPAYPNSWFIDESSAGLPVITFSHKTGKSNSILQTYYAAPLIEEPNAMSARGCVFLSAEDAILNEAFSNAASSQFVSPDILINWLKTLNTSYSTLQYVPITQYNKTFLPPVFGAYIDLLDTQFSLRPVVFSAVRGQVGTLISAVLRSSSDTLRELMSINNISLTRATVVTSLITNLTKVDTSSVLQDYITLALTSRWFGASFNINYNEFSPEMILDAIIAKLFFKKCMLAPDMEVSINNVIAMFLSRIAGTQPNSVEVLRQKAATTDILPEMIVLTKMSAASDFLLHWADAGVGTAFREPPFKPYDPRNFRHESLYGIPNSPEETEVLPPQAANFNVFCNAIGEKNFIMSYREMCRAIVNIITNLQVKLADLGYMMRRLNWATYILSAGMFSYESVTNVLDEVSVHDKEAYAAFPDELIEVAQRYSGVVKKNDIYFQPGQITSMFLSTRPESIKTLPVDNSLILGPYRVAWQIEEALRIYVIAKSIMKKPSFTALDRLEWALSKIPDGFAKSWLSQLKSIGVYNMPLAGTQITQQFLALLESIDLKSYGLYDQVIFKGTRTYNNDLWYTEIVQATDTRVTLDYTQFVNRLSSGGLYEMLKDDTSLVVRAPVHVTFQLVDADYSGDYFLSETVLKGDKVDIDPMHLIVMWKDTNLDPRINMSFINGQVPKLYSVSNMPFRIQDLQYLADYTQVIVFNKNWDIIYDIPRLALIPSN